MIVLYIFLGLLAFMLIFTAIMIFIPFKIYIQGTYWDKNPTGQMDVYWLKYYIGARLRIKDLEHIHILIWFLGIPIPLKLPLSKDKKMKNVSDKKKVKESKNTAEKEDSTSEKEPKNKKSFTENVQGIFDAKDKIRDTWNKYKAYFKKIFVSYVTYSLEYVDAELGLKDPAETGKTAAILYSTLPLANLHDVNITWNYQKPSFNISAGVKITMKLYGILCTLLHLYRTYKKDLKNET